MEEADIEQMSRSMCKCTNICIYIYIRMANENWNRRIKNTVTTPHDDTYACNNLPHIGRTLDVRVCIYTSILAERSNGGEAIIKALNDANNHRNLLSRFSFLIHRVCTFARRKKEERERKLNYPQSTVERRYRGIIDCSRIREASYNNSLEAVTCHKSTAIPMKLI